MSYQALYRVWRPRRFEDVVGQSHITQTLQNALELKQFSHAYLFSGPRGTGKTSLAKIFAQTVNCEQAPTREPCMECSACRGILDGSISDVIEMDAASNTSVEHIREIRDKVKYASTSVPYKVYIIDEVHMISTSAFNALLKTLEEPPAHVIFILATTEPHRLPLTIISRCQRFDFKPIGTNTIVDRMKTIVEAESINVEEEALETIALTAEGGMRDALSILDQAISYSREEVTLEDVLAVTGGVAQQTLTKMTEAMYAQNAQLALDLLDDLIQAGKDPGRFVFDLIYFLRDMLLYKSGPALESLLERALVDEEFKQVAESVDVEWLQEAIATLSECQQEIRWTTSPKVFIEVALLSITNRHEEEKSSISNDEINALKARISALEKQLETIEQQPTQVEEKQEQARPRRRQQPTRNAQNQVRVPTERIFHVLDEANKEAITEIRSKWAPLLEQIKLASAPAHATIQDSKPVAASDETIIIAFRYEIHCSLFSDHQPMVESILQDHIKIDKNIIPIPEENWLDIRSQYVSTKGEPKEEEKEEEETNDELIEKAKELVGEQLIDVRDE